ncbi:MAG: hypothetical protein C5B53_01855 [Candidatus Melainabacteria bacterium]|nr:MAG: hypothetical protein C5B53_01855 [Candidatus Melainabacteria bacterium]
MSESKSGNIDSLLKMQLSRSIADGANALAVNAKLRDYLELERQAKSLRHKKLPFFGSSLVLADQSGADQD